MPCQWMTLKVSLGWLATSKRKWVLVSSLETADSAFLKREVSVSVMDCMVCVGSSLSGQGYEIGYEARLEPFSSIWFCVPNWPLLFWYDCRPDPGFSLSGQGLWSIAGGRIDIYSVVLNSFVFFFFKK